MIFHQHKEVLVHCHAAQDVFITSYSILKREMTDAQSHLKSFKKTPAVQGLTFKVTR